MPEFDRDRYTVIVALLGMLGVEDAAQIAPERAEAKLTKRLIKQGIPEGVTDEQKTLAEEILGGKPAVAAASETEVETSVETKEPDNTGKQPYRLVGVNGEDDRVKMMAPAFAASRNKRRTDGRQWVADPGAALSEETETPTDQPKEIDVKKDKKNPKTPKAEKPVKEKKVASAEKPAKTAKTKTTPKVEKKAPVKAEKPAKAAKPAKKESKTKTPKADKPAKESKPRKAQGPRESGGAAKFRDIMADRKPHPKSEVIAEIVKAGVGEPSARAYTVWAKRSTDKTNPAKGGNPFGFVITETKTEDGVKMIRRR